MIKERLLELRFPSHPNRLCMVRALVKRTAEVVGCDETLTERLVIAVNEACMNVIQHAYKGDETGEIILEILNNDNHLFFKLKDFAEPIDLEAVKPRSLDDVRPGGLGTHFIHEIMDEFEVGHLDECQGNYLEMIKNLGSNGK